MGGYVPNTKEQRLDMLKAIGLSSMEDLFVDIPQEVRLKGELEIPQGKSELEVKREMEDLAGKNRVFRTIFRGAGAYRHYIPAAVTSIISKENFLTAYTPYQAEVSQGILQSIFEYQTMICDLTGMDASNASVYDGASAAAEGVAMCRERKRAKALISGATSPYVIQTIQTYCHGNGMEMEVIPEKDGKTDWEKLKARLDSGTACVYIQHPNFYGNLEDAKEIGELTHEAGAKFVMGVNPISFGYVLTLQAREQHIRREKASSNICSNQALCALAVTVYLSSMGNEGLREAALQSASKAHYLSKELETIGYHTENQGTFFHEFVTTSKVSAKETLDALEAQGILGGYPLDEHRILWCCTEVNTKEEMDDVIRILKEVQSC